MGAALEADGRGRTTDAAGRGSARTGDAELVGSEGPDTPSAC
jgi:hypothetical protein